MQWDISVTQRNRSAGSIAQKLIGKTDLIVVYGGDGCVTEVAAALHGTNTPMAIIPGGTANVMAKELGIPTDTMEALELLQHGKLRLKKIDMGMVNGKPFLLRVNLGIMADMVTEASRGLKDKIGQLAYGLTAMKTAAQADPVNYELKIDGKKLVADGVALTVTNSGHIGIGDFALQPGISITDGLLDIVLMKDNDPISMIQALGSALTQTESNALQHWTCKSVIITMPKKQAVIGDDRLFYTNKLKIKVVPGSLNMLVPVKSK